MTPTTATKATVDEIPLGDIAKRILGYLSSRETASRTELNRGCFQSHVAAVVLDDALRELAARGLIASEIVPREGAAGTPSTRYSLAPQPRQSPIVDEDVPNGVDEAAKPVAAAVEAQARRTEVEPVSATAARQVLALLTKLRTERASLQHELQQLRDRMADVMLEAELGDATAIAERDAFPLHEQRIGARLRQIEPSIAMLTERFHADEAARRLDRERLAFRAVATMLPKRAEIATRADELVAQLGACIRTLVGSYDGALATLRPHLSVGSQHALEPDPHQLSRAIVGRLMRAAGISADALLSLSGNGIFELAAGRESIATTVDGHHRALLARQPFGATADVAGEAA